MTWYRQHADGWLLSLHVQPGARQTRVAGLHGEALKITLAAPPVDGRANDALCQFLARCFDVPRAQVTLVSGQTSRHKRVLVHTVRDPAAVLLAAG